LAMWETGASLADHHETAEIVISLYQFKGRG